MDLKPYISCLHPTRIFNRNTGTFQIIPCGKCAACLNSRNSSMAERIKFEARHHRFTLFFTLTYDNEHLPIFRPFQSLDGFSQVRPIGRVSSRPNYFRYLPYCPYYDEVTKTDSVPRLSISHYTGDSADFGVCCKSDVINFIKRFRQKVFNYDKEITFKYYIASEYGPRTFRPHYHGLLFFDSQEFTTVVSDFIIGSWGLWKRVSGHGRNRYAFEPFCSASRFSVSGQSAVDHPNISYISDANAVAGYVANYVTSNQDLPKILRFGSFKPFRLYSSFKTFGVSDQIRQEFFEKFAGLYRSRNCYFTFTERSFDRIVTSYDKQGVPSYNRLPYPNYTQNAVWFKPERFRSLPYSQTFAVASFITRYRGELVGLPVLKWRSALHSSHTLEFDTLGMDVDSNWSCSSRAYEFCKTFSVDVDFYWHVFYYYLFLQQQYRLKCFYQSQQSYLDAGLPLTSLLSFYPEWRYDLPSRLRSDLAWSDTPILSFLVSLGFDLGDLYPDGINVSQDFVSSLDFEKSQVYVNFAISQSDLSYRRNKAKSHERFAIV